MDWTLFYFPVPPVADAFTSLHLTDDMIQPCNVVIGALRYLYNDVIVTSVSALVARRQSPILTLTRFLPYTFQYLWALSDALLHLHPLGSR